MANRSERLLSLMQALRRRRRPVAGRVLAEELGISLRSLYRDIGTLRGMGLAVDGDAGMGFQLRADVFLPPLGFNSDELEALVLGLRTVIHGPDAEMALAARNTLSKVAAVLPGPRRAELEAIGLFALPPRGGAPVSGLLSALRLALRTETAVQIDYAPDSGPSTRLIYPFALGYEGDRQYVAAWCTLRADFRRFRIDRIAALRPTAQPFPEPRRTLFHRWRQQAQLPDLT